MAWNPIRTSHQPYDVGACHRRLWTLIPQARNGERIQES
uniref:Uncharacterized protein n=1 Tax=Physcomitrium patens TaxID=3218 RepID=A0A2K1ITP2_PHYPA|nr:hypothetical protein PHYPA_024589 [Physcomitrium patens]